MFSWDVHWTCLNEISLLYGSRDFAQLCVVVSTPFSFWSIMWYDHFCSRCNWHYCKAHPLASLRGLEAFAKLTHCDFVALSRAPKKMIAFSSLPLSSHDSDLHSVIWTVFLEDIFCVGSHVCGQSQKYFLLKSALDMFEIFCCIEAVTVCPTVCFWFHTVLVFG